MKEYYYLIINENINNGLIKAQVIEPIKSIKSKKIKVINIHKANNKNRAYDISINLPFAIPYKFFLFNFLFFLTPIIAFSYAVILSLIVKRESLIISRSYFPSLVAYFLSKIKNIEYVFDSRSLFIDENTLGKNFTTNGVNYRMWRFYEKRILCNSKITTAVSMKQKEFYECVCPTVNVKLIPCYISKFNQISDSRQLDLRKDLGFQNEDIVIVYYGSLDNGWNSIEMYSNFFKECAALGYKVLVISQNYNDLILDKRMEINNVILLNTTNLYSLDLFEYLQIADYGVVLMKKAADWETRLSVKFVEYLNAGLQVIVGEYVGEAVRYAKEYFSNRSVIYNSKDDLGGLRKKGKYVDSTVSNLFGYQNIEKIL